MKAPATAFSQNLMINADLSTLEFKQNSKKT
jgi:hypothetical protein